MANPSGLLHTVRIAGVQNLLLVLAGICAATAFGAAGDASSPPPVLRLPPCAKPPAIDGKLTPAEWDGAFQGCGVLRHAPPRGVLELRKARYCLTYDKERLYLAVQTELPPWGKLDGKRRRVAIEATGDDQIELFINPARRPGSPDESFYQLIGNWAGSMCNFTHNPRVSGSMPLNAKIAFANGTADGWWTAELSVAAAELHKAELADGMTWGVNFCRFWHHPRTYSGWPSGTNYFARDRYLQVTLDRSAPVVQLLGVGDPPGGKPGVDFSLHNPGAQPRTLAVAMRVTDLAGGEVRDARQVTLAPGQRQRIALQASWSVREKYNVLEAEVTSADRSVKYFSTSLPFDKDNGRLAAWEPPPIKPAAAVEMKVCFYPGFSRLRCLLNFSAIKVAPMVTQALITVKDPSGAVIAEGVLDRFTDGEGETVIQLPRKLAEGTYTASLVLRAGNQQVAGPVEQAFVKKDFPFENNTLGLTDKVLAPWTPMRVDQARRTVSCWNRELTLDENGLMTQVKSGRYELLARPMQWVATSKGAALPWRSAGLAFARTDPQAVDFTAATSCDKLKAAVACHSEFDGMFHYTVTLAPNGDGQLDGLDLVVPLREEHAWLLHATSDGCRTNASLLTPPGQGRVWDSLQVKQWRLSGSFIPYLWLGDDRAGLCWWADSEKGWLRPADNQSPAIEVRRVPGEVQMVFHLVARPVQLKEPRTLSFALNATPVRPRPSWARGWTTGSTKADGFRNGPHLRVEGSCQWVSFGKDKLPDRPYTFASLRPISDQADAWLKQHAARLHEQGTTLVVYTDIISRAVDRGDELKHYASEWDRYNLAHPQQETASWQSNHQIAANMTPSRIDYDLWCMKHDAQLGIDGFYFDEIQTTGQLNPAAGLGFLDDEGNWESETSLFALRTYFKRLYAMLQEMGRPEPIIMPHSSSTMYAGPLAFATIPMDLEMQSRDPDPQRGQVFGLGEPYALCNIMAFQHGFAGSGMVSPAPLSAYAAGDYRIARTFLGSMLLLDCHPIFGVPAPIQRQMDFALGQFGYDNPKVQYVPYWRAADLQTLAPDRLRVSLFRNNNRALLVMYNDSPNHVTARWKATERFGPSQGYPRIVDLYGVNGGTHYLTSRDPDGSWLVYLPPYDYRLVEVHTRGTWGAMDDWGPVDPKFFQRNTTRAR